MIGKNTFPLIITKNDLVLSIESKIEVDVYKHGTAIDDKTWVVCKNLLRAAFPSVTPEFCNVLEIMAMEKNFTKEKLFDSVKNCIATCKYPNPSIAEIVSYEKKIILLSFDQMSNLEDIERVFYKAVEIEGREKPLWAHISDIKKYGLKTKN